MATSPLNKSMRVRGHNNVLKAVLARTVRVTCPRSPPPRLGFHRAAHSGLGGEHV